MADQPEGQSCKTCRYWVVRSAVDDTAICRRSAPVAAPRVAEDDYEAYPTWPQTLESEWCGEYAPAKPETITEGAATLARLVLLGDLTAARALADKLRE